MEKSTFNKMITNVLMCTICKQSINGKDSFENQSCFILQSAAFEFEFAGLYLYQAFYVSK